MTNLSHNQLKQLAESFFAIPNEYILTIDEINAENALFLWEKEDSDEVYSVELDNAGQLLSLVQPTPSKPTDKKYSNKDLQIIAQQFLAKHYPEALNYFTLTKQDATEKSVHFRFKQFVDAIPLNGSFCMIEVAYNGMVIEFNYKNYVENPPRIPDTIVSSDAIVKTLQMSEWLPKLLYVNNEWYSVETTGLHLVYQNPLLHHSFDAITGADLFDNEEDEIEEGAQFVELPEVTLSPRLKTMEEIIGIPKTMELIRQREIDTDTIGMVWREKDYKAPSVEPTLATYMDQRCDGTVKATLQVSTQQLKGFVWFKKRSGDLQLSYEQCLEKAVIFIKNYFSAYIPFLKLEVAQQNQLEDSPLFFTFGIFAGKHPLASEQFILSVNCHTGEIESLMTPKISAMELKNYVTSPLLAIEQAKDALNDLEATLEWQLDEAQDKEIERLVYRIVHKDTNQSILGIHAMTGKLITMCT